MYRCTIGCMRVIFKSIKMNVQSSSLNRMRSAVLSPSKGVTPCDVCKGVGYIPCLECPIPRITLIKHHHVCNQCNEIYETQCKYCCTPCTQYETTSVYLNIDQYCKVCRGSCRVECSHCKM
jgi:hypothetical protein